ncbi:MAG: hypothetical protein FIB07_07735 [Candidatus Methanoperedens sp.]|nr:hypothetical protein [Candidatus Methanoperedens sp.]
MVKAELKVPTWVERRYSLLWDAFGDSEFNIEQAAKILEEKNKDRQEKENTNSKARRKSSVKSSLSIIIN